MCKAIRFFLNVEEKMAMDQKQAKEVDWDEVNRIDYHSYSKKTAARKRHVQRQLKNRKVLQKKREIEDQDMDSPNNDKGVEAAKKLYPAIELLHDPQGLAETVFKRLRGQVSYKYEAKLLMINFVTRLIGNHQLLLLPVYPFLQRYMGGHQRDVTAVLAYAIQSCHEYVPPDEVYGILKTIAHNFITERCTEEQMAVGINAVRAICARVPSVLSKDESKETTGATVMDIEAFARDLAAYSNHRDRSVSIAGKAWTNFVREMHPSLLQGKARGMIGSALHKAGEKPLRYGQQRVSSGVEGAELLLEYEAKKKARDLQSDGEIDEDGDENDGWEDVDDEEEEEEATGGDESAEGWIDVEEDEFEDDVEGEEQEDSDDESAPDLVLLKDEQEKDADKGETTEQVEMNDDNKILDVSKMTAEERAKVRQDISSTRVFTTADFVKMKKLVERERRAKRDPREAARRKRAIAQGKDFQELSDDDADEDDAESEDGIKIAGAVNPEDINADAKRKRQTKAEKLEKIIAGREKFETKDRRGGSTNIEKKRKKNFVMSKFSFETRSKSKGKSGIKKRDGPVLKHDAKKRRRKV
jgi:protein SDA1